MLIAADLISVNLEKAWRPARLRTLSITDFGDRPQRLADRQSMPWATLLRVVNVSL
ncbi:hypothetical protein ACYZTX_00540 [Pseudomonas sp. MDT1-17]